MKSHRTLMPGATEPPAPPPTLLWPLPKASSVLALALLASVCIGPCSPSSLSAWKVVPSIFTRLLPAGHKGLGSTVTTSERPPLSTFSNVTGLYHQSLPHHLSSVVF